MQGTIASLHSYPVKSAAGIELPGAEIGQAGFEWDRRWMLINDANRYLSQRQIPKMALLSASLSKGQLCIKFPGRPSLTISTSQPDPGERISATMHRAEETIPVVSEDDEVSAWFEETLKDSFRSGTLRLVRIESGFTRRIPDDPASDANQIELADGYPYLVTSRASLARLNDRIAEGDSLAVPLGMNRFRPNIVLDLDEPWAEMRENLILRSEDREIQFRLAKPCQRCGIPQVNPETGESDTGGDLHRILTELNSGLENPSNYFGQNAIPQKGLGRRLEVGMRIEIAAEAGS